MRGYKCKNIKGVPVPKSQAVAKYSVLNESKQIFASKYLQFLPSEQELQLEIEKERRMIETSMKERKIHEQD